MRAVVMEDYGSFEGVRPRDWPDPVPGPGEVLIEIHATAANYVDILVMGGKHQFRPNLPFIPGKGPAGIVRALGDGVAAFKPGDRVVGMCEPGGGYAELIAMPASQCHPIPDSLSFADGASMALVYDTAWLSLIERGRLSDGETVLILGATGGVGLAAVQLARAKGAKVLAGVPRMERAGLVRDAGAHAVIDLGSENLRDSLREQVYAETEGRGADVIVDPLGGDVFDAALRAAAWRGRVVVIGFAAGRIPEIRANYLLVRNIEVSGLQISDYRRRTPDIMADCFADIYALYEAGRITPLPTTTLPIERLEDALSAIWNRTAEGRIVLLQDR